HKTESRPEMPFASGGTNSCPRTSSRSLAICVDRILCIYTTGVGTRGVKRVGQCLVVDYRTRRQQCFASQIAAAEAEQASGLMLTSRVGIIRAFRPSATRL